MRVLAVQASYIHREQECLHFLAKMTALSQKSLRLRSRFQLTSGARNWNRTQLYCIICFRSVSRTALATSNTVLILIMQVRRLPQMCVPLRYLAQGSLFACVAHDQTTHVLWWILCAQVFETCHLSIATYRVCDSTSSLKICRLLCTQLPKQQSPRLCSDVFASLPTSSPRNGLDLAIAQKKWRVQACSSTAKPNTFLSECSRYY